MARRLKEFTPGRGYTREDWDEVSDPHEPTEAQWAQARPFAEVFPEWAAEIAAETALANQMDQELVSLALDRDVAAGWRATGEGWKNRMSAALRAALRLHEKA